MVYAENLAAVLNWNESVEKDRPVDRCSREEFVCQVLFNRGQLVRRVRWGYRGANQRSELANAPLRKMRLGDLRFKPPAVQTPYSAGEVDARDISEALLFLVTAEDVQAIRSLRFDR